MLALKGRYDYYLTNVETGAVEYSWTQWNTITDSMYKILSLGGSFSRVHLTQNYRWRLFGKISLSNTVPTPGTDYRKCRAADAAFNTVVSSTDGTGLTAQHLFTSSLATRSAYVNFTFTPPVSDRVITVIGLSLIHNFYESNFVEFRDFSNWCSFIELTSPITQTSTQSLTVKYTLFLDVDLSYGIYSPNNNFLRYNIRETMSLYGMAPFGLTPNNGYSQYGGVIAVLTPFLNPANVDNLQRPASIPTVIGDSSRVAALPRSHYESLLSTLDKTSLGSKHAYTVYLDMNIATEGPIGSISLVNWCPPDSTTCTVYPLANELRNTQYFKDMLVCGGYSPIESNTPSISRVFTHPVSRLWAVFNDPQYPPESRGTLTPSGTPTNNWAIVAKAHITRTGDASNIVDETISSTVVDTVADTMEVTQTWATGDKVQFTGVDLPDPLVESTDYYVVYTEGTPKKINLSTSYEDATAEPPVIIDLTTTGSGNFVLSRQNTGAFKLDLEAWTYDTVYPIYQLSMGLDANGKVMPAFLHAYQSYGEGGTANPNWESWNGLRFTNIFESMMVYQHFQIGTNLYTIQKSRVGGYLNLCVWPINTLETSQALFQLGTTAMDCTSLVYIGTKAYIGTTGSAESGVYVWDSSTPVVAPSKLAITGIINDTIKDLAYDEITGYLWSGHTTGLSKIDLGTLTATQYLNTAGAALDGLTATDVNISPGHLCAHNGFVLRGGQTQLSCTGGSDSSDRSVWLMQDGIGYYKIKVRAAVCTIRKSTGQVVIRNHNNFEVSTVTITGKGTGSVVVNTTVTALTQSESYYHPYGQLVEFNRDKFLWGFHWGSYYTYTHYNRDWQTQTESLDLSDTYGSPTAGSRTYTHDMCNSLGSTGQLFGCTRNLLTLGESTKAVMYSIYVLRANFDCFVSLGWNGAAWEIGHSGSKPITLSSIALKDGVSVTFGNTIDQPWDTQFVAGDRFTFIYAPTIIKDNLQTYTAKIRSYNARVVHITGWSTVIPAVPPYEVTIPEVSSDPDFNDLDSDALAMKIFEGVTEYTHEANIYSNLTNVDINQDYFDMNTLSFSTGDLCQLSSNGGNYSNIAGLMVNYPYYLIKMSSTRCRLAYTYAQALANQYVNMTDYQNSGGYITKYVSPSATLKYNAKPDGTIQFHSSDAGKTVTINYTYTRLI